MSNAALREIVGDEPELECNGDVLIGDAAIACLLTIGVNCALVDRSTVRWRPQSDARVPDERLAWLPRALRDAQSVRRPIHLLARVETAAEYHLLGTAHLSAYGGLRGQETATFSLDQALGHAVAARLGHAPAPPDALAGSMLLEAVAQARTATTRFELARRFVESWRGPLHGNDDADTSKPLAVQRWHALHTELATVNELVACQPAAWFRDEGVNVFQRESQDVIRWGIRDEHAELDDPPVVARMDDAWFDACPSLSQWALQLVIAAEVFDSRGVAGWVDLSDEVARIVPLLEPVGLPDAHWPCHRTRVLVGPRSIAVLSGLESESGAQIHLATHDDDSFASEIRRLRLSEYPWEVRRR